MLRMRRTQFSDRVHICAKWRRRRLSTTETRRDLVKLFSAGESLSPVPGFDRGSCVPPDPRSNYAAGLILRMGPAAPCYLTVEAPPQQPLPLPPSLSLRDVVLAYGTTATATATATASISGYLPPTSVSHTTSISARHPPVPASVCVRPAAAPASVRRPANSSLGPLTRTWARSSAPGPSRPANASVGPLMRTLTR